MAEERTVYHVAYDSEGWEVQREGGERASNRYDRKDAAIERARELAQAREPSQVIIHKQDGTIQTEYTYGDDPYPPEG